MTAPLLAKALLIPFKPKATEPDETAKILFDFNPETLTLKVSSGQALDPSRRTRQQTQHVGDSNATLSFECLFDSTRPRDNDQPHAEDASKDPDVLRFKEPDVRRRTAPIAQLLQIAELGEQPAPKRVRFLWGRFSFDGVVSQHQEVFDYFSAGGVPLRSKVTLTLTAKKFRYNRTPEQASEQSRATAENQAATPRSSSAEQALVAAVLPGVAQPSQARIGQALAAGVSLGAREALDLFGAAALPAGLDLSRSALAGAGDGGSAVSPRRAPEAGQPASSWAREAAPPQSASAGLATQVASQRQGGLDSGTRPQAFQPATPAPSVPLDPPPIQGHAPLRARLALQPDPRLFPQPLPADRPSLERRPLWEGLPVTSLNPRFGSGAGVASDDCGCNPHGQGGRP